MDEDRSSCENIRPCCDLIPLCNDNRQSYDNPCSDEASEEKQPVGSKEEPMTQSAPLPVNSSSATTTTVISSDDYLQPPPGDLPVNKSSESTIFGPTIDETIIYFLGMILPDSWRSKMGFICDHVKMDVKAGSRVDSGKARDAEVYIATLPARDHLISTEPLDLEDWLRKEYLILSREVAQACMNTKEATRAPIDASMLEARRYVLNRLAELMAKKQVMESEHKCRSRSRKDKGDAY